MRASLLLVFVTCGLATAQPKDAAKEDLKKMQGTWKTVSVTYNGKEMPKLGDGKMKFVVKGDTVTIEASAAVKKEYGKIKVALEPSTMPKSLDISVVVGTAKGGTMEGIYELKGNDLKMCVKVFGMDRPTKFESPEGQSIVLVVLKREKK